MYKAGQTVLIVEDLVTSGMSVFETIRPVEAEGLIVKDVVVLLDREQGGRTNVENGGKVLHSVFTVSQVRVYLELRPSIDCLEDLGLPTGCWQVGSTCSGFCPQVYC